MGSAEPIFPKLRAVEEALVEAHTSGWATQALDRVLIASDFDQYSADRYAAIRTNFLTSEG